MSEIHPVFDKMLSRADRENALGQKSKVFWLTGLSGSGKSTIAANLEKKLFAEGYFAQMIDGDNTRSGLCRDLGFSMEERRENIRRVAELARLYCQSGIIAICSFISPTREIRGMARSIIGSDDFEEIYVKADLQTCEDRDVKGLYEKARKGEIEGFTGIDSPYEEPDPADLVLDTTDSSVEESVHTLYDFILERIASSTDEEE